MIIRYFLEILTIIFVGFSIVSVAYAQNASTPPPAVTSPPNPTPTAPVPNFQYLPQKAYVIPFAPENGVPRSVPQILPAPAATPTVAPTVATPVAATNGTSIPGMDIAGVLAMAGAAAAYVKGHLAKKKVDKVEDTTKTTMGAVVQDKESIKEIARVLFEFNKEQADKLQNAPSIKLETLEKDKAEFSDKAAKS